MFVVQAFCLTLQQPLCLSKCCSPSNKHSSVSIEQFKTFLSPDDALSVNSVADGRGRCLEKLETIISKSWWTLCSWLTRHVYHLCPSPMLPPAFLFHLLGSTFTWIHQNSSCSEVVNRHASHHGSSLHILPFSLLGPIWPPHFKHGGDMVFGHKKIRDASGVLQMGRLRSRGRSWKWFRRWQQAYTTTWHPHTSLGDGWGQTSSIESHWHIYAKFKYFIRSMFDLEACLTSKLPLV